MKNIPKDLSFIINKEYTINTLKIANKAISKIDKTTKYLFGTSDNNYIESVSMVDKNRHTVCLSSQIGCNVDCDFCATGKMGIIRNLKTGEIIDQLIILQNNSDMPITNIVFMGMGEPFLNYANVIKACKIFCDTKGFNFSYKRITISTSGILPKIEKYINEKEKYKLAISLNASNNEIRNKIIPINKKWNIEMILEALKNYKFNKTTPIMFEYIMLKDFNDSYEHANELAKLFYKTEYKINLIPFNVVGDKYSRSTTEQINLFADTLNKKTPKLRVLVRWSRGEDIDAACGQLATKNEQK
jgi:23S rRNA (adenine2503-C2)-methyltransferase